MKIKKAREKQGYTQEYVSRYLDISLRHYQNIESEKNIPNINTGLKLCKLLKICPNKLFK